MADYKSAPNHMLTTQSEREEEIVRETLRKFGQLQTNRTNFEQQWEEIALLIDPPSANTFRFGNYNTPGLKKTDRQVDATGAMALSRFASICNSLITPRNMTWHNLGTDNEYLMKNREVRLYYEAATRVLFKKRYAPLANFSSQNQARFKNIGGYGTAGLFVDELDDNSGQIGLRYRAFPAGETYLTENHQGIVDGFVRPFGLTARQAAQRWGEENLPPALMSAYEARSEMKYIFLHHVCPRSDYDPDRLDAKGKLYASYYVSMEGRWLMSEGGYRTFPLSASRYDQSAGEVYGRSPAMMVLPALKTLNAEKRVFLKQGHRAADPVLLTRDDGLVDFSMRPGALNKGGMNSDGKPLVGILPTGNIQVTMEMMDEERSLIKDAFLVSLFQMLEKNPQMTATEVVERANEKGILIAPTVGGLQDDLGTQIDRELDILSAQGALPEMPGLLKEAKGEYHVIYTSPLAKTMRAQEVAGFLRTVENAANIANITQDPSYLDQFSFDRAIPAMADIQGSPVEWMASEEEVGTKRETRAKQAQVQQQIQAAPAAAAMMKAQQTTKPAQ